MAADVAEAIVEEATKITKKDYENDTIRLEIKFNEIPLHNVPGKTIGFDISRIDRVHYMIDIKRKIVLNGSDRAVASSMWEFVLRCAIRNRVLECTCQNISGMILSIKKNDSCPFVYGIYDNLSLHDIDNETKQYKETMNKLLKFATMCTTPSMRVL